MQVDSESVNNSAAFAILGDKQWVRDWGGQSEKDVKPYVAAKEVGRSRLGRGPEILSWSSARTSICHCVRSTA